MVFLTDIFPNSGICSSVSSSDTPQPSISFSYQNLCRQAPLAPRMDCEIVPFLGGSDKPHVLATELCYPLQWQPDIVSFNHKKVNCTSLLFCNNPSTPLACVKEDRAELRISKTLFCCTLVSSIRFWGKRKSWKTHDWVKNERQGKPHLPNLACSKIYQRYYCRVNQMPIVSGTNAILLIRRVTKLRSLQ